jgi:hypothetical protein
MDTRSYRPPVQRLTLGLPRQRRAELEARLGSLEREMDLWAHRTELGASFPRHHSQVRRLANVFAAPNEAIRAELQALGDPTAFLGSVESVEKKILAIHAIWEVFRSKLILREDELFQTVLAAFDDLAWACYEPALRRFATVPKTPPLVYFTAAWSPFALGRDASFAAEVRGGVDSSGALADDDLLAILRSLPVPLIGIPWYHASYIPSAIIIAHEAGHVVEQDFALSAPIAAALAGAKLAQPERWRSWASEVFADLWGCLTMGPAFVGAMMDLLAGAVQKIQGEKPREGAYPTRNLRVALMLETLSQMGLKDDSERLGQLWQATYGPQALPADFGDDMAKVVVALIAGPYRDNIGANLSLRDLVTLPAGYGAKRLQHLGEYAAANRPQGLVGETDPRLLFAAARWLHENPEQGPSAQAFQIIVDQVVQKGTNQVRTRGGGQRDGGAASEPPTATLPTAAFQAPTPEQQREDRTVGLKVLDLLTKSDRT